MEELRELLVKNGADLVGFADLKNYSINNELSFGISVAIKLSPELVNSIKKDNKIFYYMEFNRIYNLLDEIIIKGTEYLIKNGFKAYAQTKKNIKFTGNLTTYLPHKTVATRAGLGWIGKCGLFISNDYGSGIRISSLLTNAKLECGKPIEKSFCGKCLECVINCPTNAITGKIWNKDVKREELIDVNKCIKTAEEISLEKINGETNFCGKCFYVCPYTIKNM